MTGCLHQILYFFFDRYDLMMPSNYAFYEHLVSAIKQLGLIYPSLPHFILEHSMLSPILHFLLHCMLTMWGGVVPSIASVAYLTYVAKLGIMHFYMNYLYWYNNILHRISTTVSIVRAA